MSAVRLLSVCLPATGNKWFAFVNASKMFVHPTKKAGVGTLKGLFTFSTNFLSP